MSDFHVRVELKEAPYEEDKVHKIMTDAGCSKLIYGARKRRYYKLPAAHYIFQSDEFERSEKVRNHFKSLLDSLNTKYWLFVIKSSDTAWYGVEASQNDPVEDDEFLR